MLRLLSVFLLVGFLPSLAYAGEAMRPNVLFIAIDDLNDWVGCLGGHPQAKTPYMDALAQRGTVFLNAHCQAPLCNPSRASILTGLRPSTSGIYGLNPWFRTAEGLQNWVTLPQYFTRNGYRTYTTGKVFHDAYPPKPGRKDGVEFSEWGYHGGFQPRPKKRFVNAPAKTPLMDWGIFPERDDQQDDWKVADWAINKIETMPKDQPFFLCVGFRHPHVPCYATQKWFDLYPEKEVKLPPYRADDRDDTPRFSWYLHWKLPEPRQKWLAENKQWKPLVRSYLASISFVDSQVGRVLEALKKSEFADNTIVIVWSDHGYHLGEKAISGKNTLWERSTRVPLIFAGPGVSKDAKCERPVELLDVYPTLVDLCNLPKRKGLDGHSLVPLLKNANAKRPWPAITTHGPNNHTIRTEQWRYIRYADGTEELYDMRNDPNEWHNLAKRTDLQAKKKELAQWLPKVNRPPVATTRIRLIELRDGVPYWEGQRINANDPIPMDD